MIWLLSNIVLFVGSLGLLIAAYASEQQGVATAVPVLILFVAIPSLLSVLIHFLLNQRIKSRNLMQSDNETNSNSDNDSCLLPKADAKKMMQLLETGLRPTAQSVALYFAPSISLFLIILLRLIASPENFQGDPSNLDFGPKYGITYGEPNVAFTPEFNSVGHSLQGVLASMLAFPAVSGVMTQMLTCKVSGWWTECNRILCSFIKLVACFMTIYPTYNLVKRLIRSADTFATSSFCNNSFEWAFGFMIGLALGNLVTIMAKRSVTLKVLESDNFQETLHRANGESWVLGTQREPDYQPKLNGLQFFMGIVLMFTVFTAAVMFGLTWHTCMDDGDDCVNYSDDGIAMEVLVVMVIIPTVIITVMSCGECMRFRK